MNKILVIGSTNIDMIACVKHLPRPGETVGEARFMQSNGGKGANQAVAAARLGGDVAPQPSGSSSPPTASTPRPSSRPRTPRPVRR